MSNGVKISPKYGLNPSMTVCFWCGETTGIALMGKITDKKTGEDVEAPRYCFGGYEPCEKCQKNMELGTVVMEASTHEVFPGQPEFQEGVYPTGSWVVLKPESAERILGQALKKVFVDRELFKQFQV